MSFENLFIGSQKSIGGIYLDAVLTETHNNAVRTTTNPVELGADITDHAIIEPKKITITAQVSDTPLGLAAFGEIVDSITGFFGSSTEQNITRSVAAYNAIVDLMEKREPIEVQTKLKLYRDMLVTELSTSQDKDTSRVALMNISLTEVLITESEIVKLDPDQLEDSVRNQASSASEKGRQEPNVPNDTDKKSILKTMAGWM